MNEQAYIASGILEVYALGGLDKEEVLEVRRILNLYPSVKRALNEVEQTLENSVLASGRKPKAEVKGKLFAQLETKSTTNVQPLFQPRSLLYYKYATAASVALFISSSVLAFLFWSNWQSATAQLTLLEQQTAQYADKIKKANYRLDLILSPSVEKITLKGVALAPNALAVVYWDKQSKEVFIYAAKLPKAPEGMQYQLWALKDGLPIDAGVFEDTNGNELQKVKAVQEAQVYAVTLEKKGGSKTPTLSALYVIGEV